jgi:L-3-cyanoalanine synthase/cysteine synthase
VASLMSFHKRTPFSSFAVVCQHSMMMKRLLTTTDPIVDFSSLAQRIRHLPKDLPETNIKKHVSQVI